MAVEVINSLHNATDHLWKVTQIGGTFVCRPVGSPKADAETPLKDLVAPVSECLTQRFKGLFGVQVTYTEVHLHVKFITGGPVMRTGHVH